MPHCRNARRVLFRLPTYHESGSQVSDRDHSREPARITRVHFGKEPDHGLHEASLLLEAREGDWGQGKTSVDRDCNHWAICRPWHLGHDRLRQPW